MNLRSVGESIRVGTVIGAERRGRVYRARLRSTLAVSGPRHGDPSSRGRICTRSVARNPWSRRPGVESSGGSIDSKKTLCNGPTRTSLSATSTVAVVQVCCNTMTPVAPVLQLSSEANAIMAAINAALAPRLDGIQGQMGMLAGQMTSLKSDVVQLSAQVQHRDWRMSQFERQLKEITAGSSTGSGAASSAASSEHHPEPARGSGTVHPPKNQRTVLVVGGFAYDTEKGCDLREIFGQEPGVKDWWTPGKVGSVGKVNFHTNDHIWTFLRKYKGKKFSHGPKQL